MSLDVENVEQVDIDSGAPPPEAPVEVDPTEDRVRPDGPGSGRSAIRKSLEKSFADERKREDRDRGRQRTERAVDQYREEADAVSESEPVDSGEPQQAPSNAPEAWTREAKAEWQKLPPVVQQAVLKREQDSARGVEELKQRYSDIDQALAPRLDLIRQHGHTPGQAVNQLFAWFDSLGHDVERIRNGQEPISFISLAKSFGLDPAQAFLPSYAAQVRNYLARTQQAMQQPQQQQPQQQQDPNAQQQTLPPEQLQYFSQYNNYLRQLGERQQQLEQFYNQKLGSIESTFQAQSQAKTDEMLAQWAKDKPYYEDVRQSMARMIASYQVPPLANGNADLDKAYDMACWAIPEIRQRILADQEAKASADRQAKAEAEKKARTEAAAKARKAAVGLAPQAPGTGNSALTKRASTGKSVRDSLIEAWEDSRR